MIAQEDYNEKRQVSGEVTISRTVNSLLVASMVFVKRLMLNKTAGFTTVYVDANYTMQYNVHITAIYVYAWLFIANSL